MYSFRKLQAIILGHDDDCDHDHEKDALCSTLRASDVPVSLADCRSCSDPCDLGILANLLLLSDNEHIPQHRTP